jgi:serine/threonine protein kinase
MLYEMAAAKPPFDGRTGFELTSSILRDAPPILPEQVPEPPLTPARSQRVFRKSDDVSRPSIRPPPRAKDAGVDPGDRSLVCRSSIRSPIATNGANDMTVSNSKHPMMFARGAQKWRR